MPHEGVTETLDKSTKHKHDVTFHGDITEKDVLKDTGMEKRAYKRVFFEGIPMPGPKIGVLMSQNAWNKSNGIVEYKAGGRGDMMVENDDMQNLIQNAGFQNIIIYASDKGLWLQATKP